MFRIVFVFIPVELYKCIQNYCASVFEHHYRKSYWFTVTDCPQRSIRHDNSIIAAVRRREFNCFVLIVSDVMRKKKVRILCCFYKITLFPAAVYQNSSFYRLKCLCIDDSVVIVPVRVITEYAGVYIYIWSICVVTDKYYIF